MSGPTGDDPAIKDVASKKLAAGICGILLGSLGVHKFILGNTTPAVIMLASTVAAYGLGSFLCFPVLGAAAMHVIGVVEGIIYLTKSDQDFHQTYIVQKKEWF